MGVFSALWGCIVGIRARYCVAALIEPPKCFRKRQHHLTVLQGVCEVCQYFLLCPRSLLSVLLWRPVGFTDISLLINNAEHLFKCLSDHFISLNKCLFKFSIFKIACLVSFFFFVIKASMYLLYSPTRLANVCSAVSCLSTPLRGCLRTSLVRRFTPFSLDEPTLGVASREFQPNSEPPPWKLTELVACRFSPLFSGLGGFGPSFGGTLQEVVKSCFCS